MAQTCMVISLKVITFTTFLLGACVIITCCWTLTAVLKTLQEVKEIEKTTPTPTSGLNENYERTRGKPKIKRFEFEPANSTMEDIDMRELHVKFPKFDKMEGSYRTMVICCLSASIIAGFAQMTSSMFTVSSCSKKTNTSARGWMILHGILFLIFLTALVVPLTYHPEKGMHIKISELIPSAKSRFQKVIEKHNSLVGTMTHDLNAYFVILGLNEALLLIFMICLCFCSQCVKKSYEPLR